MSLRASLNVSQREEAGMPVWIESFPNEIPDRCRLKMSLEYQLSLDSIKAEQCRWSRS